MKIKSEENKVHQYRRYRIIILPLSLSKGPPPPCYKHLFCIYTTCTTRIEYFVIVVTKNVEK